MKVVLSILTGCALVAAAQAQTSRWNPYGNFGRGSWEFEDGQGRSSGSANWNPYGNFGRGSWDIQNGAGQSQGSWNWNPYGNFGRGQWEFQPH